MVLSEPGWGQARGRGWLRGWRTLQEADNYGQQVACAKAMHVRQGCAAEQSKAWGDIRACEQHAYCEEQDAGPHVQKQGAPAMRSRSSCLVRLQHEEGERRRGAAERAVSVRASLAGSASLGTAMQSQAVCERAV